MEVDISRRDFLRGSALLASGAFLAKLGVAPTPQAQLIYELHKPIGEITTICTFCSTGCSMLAAVDDAGNVISLEGNPDSPINEGRLCPKGQSAIQLLNSPRRLYRPLYRAPNSMGWTEISWDDAISMIAQRIKETRDSTFETVHNGVTVNRTLGLAFVGSPHIPNEVAYLIHKFSRALGIIYLEHAARICHSPTAGGLAPSYGRGAETNNPVDLRNADIVLYLGSNQAEAHPLSFYHVIRAKELNPSMKIIVVDPQFSRTAAHADIYARMRPGTDVAFLGYLINYAFTNNRVNMDYVRYYTNGPMIVKDTYGFDPSTGLFTGYNPDKRAYDTSLWGYEMETVTVNGQSYSVPKKDMTMTDPRSVFQLTKQFYSRYTRSLVSSVTGIPEDLLDEIADTYTQIWDQSTGLTGTIVWSLGVTLHNNGSQIVRAIALLQLLLGMVGVPGGGANVMRGHSNVQGATDMYVLFDMLPGYLPAPDEFASPTFDEWVKVNAPPYGFKNNYGKFLVALLKAWFGDAATADNDWAYDYLPKKFGDHSFMEIFNLAWKGQIQGMILLGQNPAAMLADANMVRAALSNLKWVVIIDPMESETVDFWKAPGIDPATVGTEVFYLPATSFLEHDGSKTTTGRWIQWQYAVTTPRGDSKTDEEIVSRIALAVKDLYASSTDPKDAPIQALVWPYGPKPNLEDVLKEINGYDLATGELLPNFIAIASAPYGAVSAGNWIYSGVFGEGVNRAKSTDTSDPSGLGLYPGWGYAWPLNRRIMYNRASCDVNGNPRYPKKAIIWWNPTVGEWQGWDVPDFSPTKPPSAPFNPAAEGLAALSGTDAFIMQPDGRGWIFSTTVVTDGPLPEHYEPYDHPIPNLFHPNGSPTAGQIDPVAHFYFNAPNDAATVEDGYDVIATTGRFTEHYHTFTTYITWPNQLIPEMFAKISPTLAQKLGVSSGDYLLLESPRGKLKIRAFVTDTVGPVTVNGQTFEIIWLPVHGGFNSLIPGQDNVNLLMPSVGDGYEFTPEAKPLLVKVTKWGGGS
jgi:formate dehydrogenase major subunit